MTQNDRVSSRGGKVIETRQGAVYQQDPPSTNCRRIGPVHPSPEAAEESPEAKRPGVIVVPGHTSSLRPELTGIEVNELVGQKIIPPPAKTPEDGFAILALISGVWEQRSGVQGTSDALAEHLQADELLSRIPPDEKIIVRGDPGLIRQAPFSSENLLSHIRAKRLKVIE